MGNGQGKDDGLDVLTLLHEVHGTEEGARSAAVEQALRTLEATHRRASLAMQTFEREGNPSARRAAQPPPAPRPQGDARPVAEPPRTAAHAPDTGDGATAIWRPDDAPPGEPPALPPRASPEATAVGPLPENDAANLSRAPAAPAVDVYAGRGADWSLRERTKTQRIVRPKKDT